MNRIKLIDTEPVAGSRWCRHCKRAKPVHLFGRTYCRTCTRLLNREYRQTPEAKAAERARKPRDRSAYLAAWKASERGKEAHAAWRASLRGKLSVQRSELRQRLKKAETTAQRVRLRGLIEQVTAELAKARAIGG